MKQKKQEYPAGEREKCAVCNGNLTAKQQYPPSCTVSSRLSGPENA